MVHIRSIETEELPMFVSTATEPKYVGDIRQYVEDLIAKGAMRTDWCYLAERDDQPIGRAAFWTLPKRDQPLDLVLLDLPWQSESAFEVGAALLREMFRVASSLGATQLEYVLDTPVQRPQWQTYPDSRASLLERCGFSSIRETLRFEFEPNETEHRPSVDHELAFRSMADVGENAFVDAVRRVSADSLDRRTREQREELGPEGEAIENVEDLESMEYDPTWWEVAYTLDEDFVGVIVPAEIPAGAAIGYIGVVPEMRGRGYVDSLLARGTVTLIETGAERIIADTDVHNTPIANAFKRAGYSRFARRREYRVSIDE